MNLNGKTINPGELRTPIKLGTRSVTPDAGAFPVASYTSFADVFSKWTWVHGPEVWTAQAVQAEQPATVLIRYNATLDGTCGVQLSGQWYEIVSIDDLQQRHEYIELKVKRFRSG